MTQVHGKNVIVLYNGINLSGDFTSIDLNQTVDTVDISTFGDTDHEYMTGTIVNASSWNTIWNDGTAASGAAEANFTPNLGSATLFPAMVIPNNVVASRAYGAHDAMLSAYNVGGAVSDAVKASGSFQCSGGLRAGSLIHHHTQRTTAANTTGAADAAGVATTRGARAYFQLTQVTGGSVTMTIEHSATQGGAYAQLLTFSAQAAVGGFYQTIAVGVNINGFVRATWTQTASSWTGAVVFARLT